MRVIEKEMLNAIANKKDWRKDNTEVRYYEAIDTPMQARLEMAKVFLHGHHIATFAYGYELGVNKETLRSWPTPTTKSRLRALGVNVYTKRGVTYLNDEAI